LDLLSIDSSSSIQLTLMFSLAASESPHTHTRATPRHRSAKPNCVELGLSGTCRHSQQERVALLRGPAWPLPVVFDVWERPATVVSVTANF
jgi:hypothetical protein